MLRVLDKILILLFETLLMDIQAADVLKGDASSEYI